MNLYVRIIEPTAEIFKQIEFYQKYISHILPDARITLIGSFAVPMCGKEEFDLLVEVDDVKKAQQIISFQEDGRFGAGPIIEGEGFCRSKKKFGIICEVHIIPFDHPKKGNYLFVVNTLKNNIKLTKEYSEFKRSLNGLSEEEYKKQKNYFLKEKIMKTFL